MIVIENLNKSFGGLRAVNDASMTIKAGSITGLIGPNGAGKTTLFNVIAGHYKPNSGSVYLEGRDITGMAPHELFKQRLLRTFQIPHEFTTLTVRENLMMVPDEQPGESLLNTWLRPQVVRNHEKKILTKADEVIEFLEISHIANELAGNLSGGQKKLLELGRTMMVDARVVFLDEVGAGVNRTLLRKIGDAILRLRDERNYTFCLIEHDMDFISRICDHVICMAEGAVMAEGTAEEIKSNPDVIEAYLGSGQKSKRYTK
ncbi:MAG: ABC transporter ATP-binding protein [Rhizobiales bacterium]|nr:ABC transporter ATP-binding protein [Hyphomicrobiales bacterium]